MVVGHRHATPRPTGLKRLGALASEHSPFVDEMLLQALYKRQTVRFRNGSGSMEPFIRPGDVLWVRDETPEVGDVAVAFLDGRWLAHRLVRLDALFMELSADATDKRHHLPRRVLVGRVIAVERDWRARGRAIGCWLSRTKAAYLCSPSRTGNVEAAQAEWTDVGI